MNIAFVGGHGHHYLRQTLAPGGHRAAVCGDGHDAAAARARAAAIPGAAWYDELETMLDGFRPDVASVGAVYGFNGDLIAAVLARGIPVVSDKPVAATAEQLARLRQLAVGPARLITEFPFRSLPEYRAAHDAVRAGKIGAPILAIAQKSYQFKTRPAWYGDRRAYGGTMLWVASHALDAVEFVSGRRFRRVCGRQGNLARPDYREFEDHVVLLGELEGGGTAVVHADYHLPAGAGRHGDDRLRLTGDRGVIEVRDGDCRLLDHAATTPLAPDAPPRPVGDALLAAALGRDDSLYHTAASLRTAALLLACRAAADEETWRDVDGRPLNPRTNG